MAAGTRDMTAGTVSARPANFTLNPFQIVNTIDFSAVQTLKGSALETNEVIKAIAIPAGTFVSKVFVQILTAGVGTGSLIATVGDGDDPDGFDTSVDLEAAAGTVTFNGNASNAAATHGDNAANVLVDAYSAGRAYTADDTIDLVLTDYDVITTHPVIKVTALCVMV